MKLRYKISGALLAVFIMALAWLGWFVSHDNDCVPAGQPGEDEASMAAIRPLITAGPMARARRPPKVAESIVVSAAWMTPVPVQITAVRSVARTL